MFVPNFLTSLCLKWSIKQNLKLHRSRERQETQTTSISERWDINTNFTNIKRTGNTMNNFTLINLTPSLTYTKWLNQLGLQEQSKPTLEISYLLKPSKPSLDIYYMLSPDSLEREDWLHIHWAQKTSLSARDVCYKLITIKDTVYSCHHTISLWLTVFLQKQT